MKEHFRHTGQHNQNLEAVNCIEELQEAKNDLSAKSKCLV